MIIGTSAMAADASLPRPRRGRRVGSFVLVVASLALAGAARPGAASPAADAATELGAQAEVASRVERLLAAMGGREAWASARRLRVTATHLEVRRPQPYANAIDNDFTAPRLRFEQRGAGLDRTIVLDGTSGTRRDGTVTRPLTPAEVAEETAWWESNVYRTLHRLARRDPTLEVRALDAERLAFHRADGSRLNWFRHNVAGEIVEFAVGDATTGTVFGPLVDGPRGLRHPAWTARADGRWRAVELRFEVAEPEEAAVR